MRFTKMHGAGNDYIYVDCISNPMPHDPAGLSRVMSDRHATAVVWQTPMLLRHTTAEENRRGGQRGPGSVAVTCTPAHAGRGR